MNWDCPGCLCDYIDLKPQVSHESFAGVVPSFFNVRMLAWTKLVSRKLLGFDSRNSGQPLFSPAFTCRTLFIVAALCVAAGIRFGGECRWNYMAPMVAASNPAGFAEKP